MNIINDFDFTVSQCDMSDIMTEVSRFMYHIVLIHIITHMIDGKNELFGSELFKTLFVTAFSVMLYHVCFKKFMNAKLKNIQSNCNSNGNSNSNNTNTSNTTNTTNTTR